MVINKKRNVHKKNQTNRRAPSFYLINTSFDKHNHKEGCKQYEMYPIPAFNIIAAFHFPL